MKLVRIRDQNRRRIIGRVCVFICIGVYGRGVVIDRYLPGAGGEIDLSVRRRRWSLGKEKRGGKIDRSPSAPAVVRTHVQVAGTGVADGHPESDIDVLKRAEC